MCSWVTDDNTVGRIGRVTRDSREGQCFGVCPIRMTIVAFQENWPIRKKFIEIFFVRQGRRPKHRVIPPTPKQPIVSRMLGGVLAETLLNLGNVFRALQIYATKAQRAV